MGILDLVHLLTSFVATVAVVWHMNGMTRTNTPRIEAFGWWLVGVGMAGDLFWHVWRLWKDIAHDMTEEHIFLTVGATLLIVLYTQPEWRPKIAERRKNPPRVAPPECEEFCRRRKDHREPA